MTQHTHALHTLVMTMANRIQILFIHTFTIDALRLVEWLYLQGTVGNDPQTEAASKKSSLILQPILNIVQKFRCCLRITGAIYCAPVYNVGSGGLAAELSLLDGSRLEVTAAPLPYSCCQGLPDYVVKCGGTRFLEKIVYIYINMQTLLASTQILCTHSHTHHCLPNIQD